VSVSEKQNILSEVSLHKRALLCLKHMNDEYQKLALKNDIQSRVRTEMDSQQREYYLHQQMKTIQEELGGVSYEEEVEEMRLRSKEKKWDNETAKYFNKELLNTCLLYLLINFFYTIYLKKIAFVDIFILSSNYILRAYMGCVALGVDLSNLISITVFFSALFISALKRKQELLLYGSVSRKVLKNYSIKGLKKIVNISAIFSILFYSLYVVSINKKLFLTIPLVIYGVLRYISHSENKNFSDSPVDEILKDKQNILIILIWLLIVINS
jgi:hypothetical protein